MLNKLTGGGKSLGESKNKLLQYSNNNKLGTGMGGNLNQT